MAEGMNRSHSKIYQHFLAQKVGESTRKADEEERYTMLTLWRIRLLQVPCDMH
jgi:hypothetical protein